MNRLHVFFLMRMDQEFSYFRFSFVVCMPRKLFSCLFQIQICDVLFLTLKGKKEDTLRQNIEFKS